LVWLLPVVVYLWAAIAAPADQFAVATNSDNTVTITHYSGGGGMVTVPDTLGGLPVTSIGDSAFAFAFSVTGVKLPGSLTNIGELAFVSCRALTNVTIPATVTSIGILPFEHCTSLAAINVAAGNPAFCSADGVLFNQAQTTLRQYPEGKGGSGFAVPAGVTDIGYGAFYNCSTLTNITAPSGLKNIDAAACFNCTSLATFNLPSGLTNIGSQAFEYCGSLIGVLLPDTMQSLGFQAYNYCTNLTSVWTGKGLGNIDVNTFSECPNLISVVVGDGVKNIGTGAFQDCSLLTILWFGSGLTNIGDSAFSYCATLSYLIFPNSLEALGNHAFEFCSGLPVVTLPGGVTSIGDGAFEFCTGLTAINVATNNPAYCSRDGVLYDRGVTRLIQYPENRSGSSFAIPPGVTHIGDTAFAFCYNLNYVTVPRSVTVIENLAFYDCADLLGLFIEGNAPTPGNDVLDFDNSATVYYLAKTTGWGATFAGRPTALWNPQVQSDAGNVGVHGAQFGFAITGTGNLPVTVEATTNLVSGPWLALGNATLANGKYYFGDPQWANFPTRYYRIVPP
jgi:hypothetical protein